MLLKPHVVLATALSLSSQRGCRRAAMIFPGASPESEPEPGAALTMEQVEARTVGFWTIYDELATEDALNALSEGAQVSKLFSTNMVLRADGQASRGSDFPGGSWSIVVDGARRREVV